MFKGVNPQDTIIEMCQAMKKKGFEHGPQVKTDQPMDLPNYIKAFTFCFMSSFEFIEASTRDKALIRQYQC